jgi:hypothetical protein
MIRLYWKVGVDLRNWLATAASEPEATTLGGSRPFFQSDAGR